MSQRAAKISLATGRVTQLALPALVGGAITIGFAPILVRLSQVGPSATAFWRVLLALPFLWLWLAVEKSGPAPPRSPAAWTDYRRLVVAGVFFTSDLAFWHWSINYTTVANATLLVNFAPIFVTLASWLLLRQRISRTFIIGLVTALTGAAILIGASVELNPQYFWGDFLALVAAVFYGGYQLSVKYLRREFSVATIMTWNSLTMCLLLLPAAFMAGETILPANLQGWLVLLALALLIHIGGQGLIAFGLGHLPATFSSVTLLLQPVMAAIFAWLLLSEALSARQVVGGMVVLGGIIIARRGSQSG